MGKLFWRMQLAAVLQAGSMPVEMVRALLTDQSFTRDYAARWRFAGDPLSSR